MTEAPAWARGKYWRQGMEHQHQRGGGERGPLEAKASFPNQAVAFIFLVKPVRSITEHFFNSTCTL